MAKKLELTSSQESVLEGVMLGDGSIYLSNNCETSGVFSLEQKTGHVTWIEEVNYKLDLGCEIHDRERRIKNYDKIYYASRIVKMNSYFKDQHDRWYLPIDDFNENFGYKPRKKDRRFVKIIPEDVRINPVSLRHFYLGDGGKSGNQVYLYTYYFPIEQVEDVLVTKLKKLGFDARTDYVRGEKSKYGYKIVVKDSDEFFRFTGTVECKGFDTKFKGVQA